MPPTKRYDRPQRCIDGTIDDTINGLHIPKNTTVFLNTYGLHHDPLTTPSPSTFNPLRHKSTALRSAADLAISPSYDQRDHYGYGSGRRLCPGIHLAERNLWLAVAKLLWAFEFTEIEGKPVDTDYRTGYSEGILCCAKPFQADVRVRGGRRETILREFQRCDGETLAKYED